MFEIQRDDDLGLLRDLRDRAEEEAGDEEAEVYSLPASSKRKRLRAKRERKATRCPAPGCNNFCDYRRNLCGPCFSEMGSKVTAEERDKYFEEDSYHRLAVRIASGKVFQW